MSDTTINAQEEKVDLPSHEYSPLQQWQIAFIYAFTATFNHHQDISPSYHKLPFFTPQDLEDEIQKEESELIHQIICACLGNILNRSKPIESFKISLQQLLADKMKVFEIDLEVNPLLKQNYNALSTDLKLYILHSLIEWQLQDSTAVKTIIDTCYQQNGRKDTNPIIAHPLGTDSKKRTYWQFGDSPWIWRETNNMKSVSQWETVCKNLQDLEQLVDSFSASTSKVEKALVKVIKEGIYEIALKEEQRKMRKERAELRKLIPIEVSITPTTLRSRGRNQRVHYNFDDIYGIDEDEDNGADEDDNFVDEDDEDDNENSGGNAKRQKSKRSPSPPRPPPTRWSNRLNRGAVDDVTNTLVESMEIDNQSMEAMDTTPHPSEQNNDMDTSRSPSFMDITPSDSPMETVATSNSVMNVTDILNPQIVHE